MCVKIMSCIGAFLFPHFKFSSYDLFPNSPHFFQALGSKVPAPTQKFHGVIVMVRHTGKLECVQC